MGDEICPTCLGSGELALGVKDPTWKGYYIKQYRLLTEQEVEEYKSAIETLNGQKRNDTIWVLHLRGTLPLYKGSSVKLIPGAK
jgi:hypothetical protein